MIKHCAFISVVLLSGCVGDETLTNFGASGKTWVLSEFNGAPFTARATIEFGDKGAVTGQAPCNRFSTTQTAPYPWFAIEPILSTKAACADLESEQTFFAALQSMSLSEVSGPVLVLSNDAEQTMVFRAE